MGNFTLPFELYSNKNIVLNELVRSNSRWLIESAAIRRSKKVLYSKKCNLLSQSELEAP